MKKLNREQSATRKQYNKETVKHEKNAKMRNKLELPGTAWNKVVPPVTRWTQQRADTNNKKFTGRSCACNTIAQQITTLATVATKSTSQMFAVGTTWNGMEPLTS